MSRRVRGAAVLTGLLIAAVFPMLFETLELHGSARLVPLAIVVPTVLLLALQLLLELSPGWRRRLAFLERPGVIGEQAAHERAHLPRAVSAAPVQASEFGVLAWVLAPLPLVALLGFALALPLYTLAYVRGRAARAWPVALAVAALVGGVALGIFELALGVPLWEGILWTWLAR